MSPLHIRGGNFVVNEHANGYELAYLPTGERAWLGDGVDMFDDEEGEPLLAGSPEWIHAICAWLRDEEETVLEEYFPDTGDHDG